MKIFSPRLTHPEFRHLFLVALVSFPVSAAVTVDKSGTESRIIQVAEPKEVVTLVTHQHTRILSTFDTDNYALKYLTRTVPQTSFIESATEIPHYEKIEQFHEVPVDKVAEFSASGHPRGSSATTPSMFRFQSVGFPHIETGRKASELQYKPFSALMTVHEKSNGKKVVVPNVACYGYSPERTNRRAARYEKQIQRLSSRYDVDPDLVKAVVAQESCFRARATSHAGAQGLMQLMPATAAWLGVTHSYNPEQNLRGGIRYLSRLKKRFGTTELALAAYNAGPGNVKRYKGIPPFSETRTYVRKVMANYQSYAASTQFASASDLLYN